MYYVCLYNATDKVVYYAEEYEDEATARRRVALGLFPQAELNACGLGQLPDGTPVDAGKDWRTYIGETEFKIPEE
jgi:hypothetical protein